MNKQEFQDQVEDVVNHYILISMGAGAIPVPVADILAVTAVQLEMLRELCSLYEVRYSKDLGKNAITAIAGNTLLRLGMSFFKILPVAGSIVGGVSMAILSGASTYAISKVFIHHLQHGKGLEDIDISLGKEIYKDAFEKGKEYAQKLRDAFKKEEEETVYYEREIPIDGVRPPMKPTTEPKEPATKPVNKDELFDQLQQLAALKDKGILTEEEFTRKKKDILSKM